MIKITKETILISILILSIGIIIGVGTHMLTPLPEPVFTDITPDVMITHKDKYCFVWEGFNQTPCIARRR